MPSVRARHLKTKLDVLSRWPGGREVLTRVDPAILSAAARAHGLDWLPVQHEISITRAAHEALGADAVAGLWTEVLLAEMDGGLFGPMTRAVRAMPGWNEDRWPDVLCKGWPLAFRACGRWAVQPTGHRSLDLRLEKLPAACVADEPWLASVASALFAVHRYLRNQGTVRLCRIEPPGTALYRSTWRAPARLAGRR